MREFCGKYPAQGRRNLGRSFLRHSEGGSTHATALPRTGRVLLGLFLALGLSGLALWLIVRAQPSGDWVASLRDARPGLLLLCLVLLVASWAADAMRFRLLGGGLGHRIRFPVLVGVIMMGNFLTLATPFMAGGAPVIIYYLSREGMPLGEASAVVILGGVASQTALALFNLGAALVLTVTQPPGAWLGRAYLGFVGIYITAIAAFVWAAFRLESLRPRLEAALRRQSRPAWWAKPAQLLLDMMGDFRRSVEQLTGRQLGRLVGAVGWAAAYFLLYFMVGVTALAALGVKGDVVTLFAFQVVAATIALFTPSPGGSGVAEFGALYTFGGVVGSAVLPAFIILWRLFTFHLNLAFGGIATGILASRLTLKGG